MTNIEYYRRQKGLSTKELAARLGISPGAVSQWESGKKKPQKGRLEAIAAALGTTVESIKGDQKNTTGLPDGAEEELAKIFTATTADDLDFLRLYIQLSPDSKALAKAYVSGLAARKT